MTTKKKKRSTSKKKKTSRSLTRFEQAKQDAKSLEALFVKNKRRIARSIFLDFLIVFAAFAIVGMRLFYPYHFTVGITIYLTSFVVLAYHLYHSRAMFRKFHTYQFARHYYKHKKKRLAVLGLLVILLLGFLTIIPLGKSPFKGMSEQDIRSQVHSDLELATLSYHELDLTGRAVLASLHNQDPSLVDEWESFLIAVARSEQLTDVHRHFVDLDSDTEEHKLSFMISYSLYVKKYEIVQQLMSTVTDEQTKKVLNQHIEPLNQNNLFTVMSGRYLHPKTRLRINAGNGYMDQLSDQDISNEAYHVLKSNAQKSYDTLFSSFDDTLVNSPSVLGDIVEKKMFQTWFPLQKSVIYQMGETYISTRDYKLIDEQDIDQLRPLLQPGDLIVTRSNWYISNVGIPGYWGHIALYTGTLDEQDEYFAELFPYKGYSQYQELILGEYPDLFIRLTTPNTKGQLPSVVESIGDGVLTQSLYKTAHADYVGVMRPQLTKQAKLQAILAAYEHVGKSYDYDFDFTTDDQIICSELVYLAYQPGSDHGLRLELEELNGRLLLSPADFVTKLDAEYETPMQELEFVAFIEGSETDQDASFSTFEEFRTSPSRARYSWQQE